MTEEKDLFETQFEFKPEIIDALKEAVENPPDVIEINVKVSGELANKLYFCQVMLQQAFNLTEEDCNKYLLRSGAEREISRLVAVYNYYSENNETE